MVRRNRRIALTGVALVSLGQCSRVDLGLGPIDASVSFESTDRNEVLRIAQPIQRGHRRAVIHQRSVP